MPRPRRNTTSIPLDDALFAVKPRKSIPHEFVLDALAPLSPATRPMFGCLAIYVKDKIVLILRNKLRNKEKRDQTADNGVWLATTEEHHQSLRQEFPNMRSIKVLGKKVTGWQVLPADAENFEETAMHACELVLAGDPRIGKVPGARRASRWARRRRKNPRSRRRAARAAPSSADSQPGLSTPAFIERCGKYRRETRPASSPHSRDRDLRPY
jgi:hypothetical protein